VNDAPKTGHYPLAATIIIMREIAGGPPELLMLERASTMAFAAGALVFPGGRVEEGDWALADALAGQYAFERDEMAQRIAGIRETIEEVGIAVGLLPAPDTALIEEIRQGLVDGEPFDALLGKNGLQFDLDALAPFARWCPPEDAPRRYDTRFFLAAAPADAVETADGGESVHALWISAAELLDADKASRHRVVFPTWCTIDRLAQFCTLEEARTDGALHAHHVAFGRVEQRDGVDWLCVDEGIGYPTTARLLGDDLRR
jgi:8-oxo-dGTP pyrophosphatase MutT (NUDIX family)